jgi:hypothetical protein
MLPVHGLHLCLHADSNQNATWIQDGAAGTEHRYMRVYDVITHNWTQDIKSEYLNVK